MKEEIKNTWRNDNMQLTMVNLENCFEVADKSGARFIGVSFQLPGNPGLEIIINPSENFESKLDYYKKVYNDTLGHDKAPGVQIVGFTYGDSFEAIQSDLIAK